MGVGLRESLHAVIITYTTLVNTHTDTGRQRLTSYTVNSTN